jgi:hypothetical protein
MFLTGKDFVHEISKQRNESGENHKIEDDLYQIKGFHSEVCQAAKVLPGK